jgi:hypothetical protein
LKDVEKDFVLDLIKRFSSLYFTEILGSCLMGNHFHLLVKMIPGDDPIEAESQDDDFKAKDAFLLGGTLGFAYEHGKGESESDSAMIRIGF